MKSKKNVVKVVESIVRKIIFEGSVSETISKNDIKFVDGKAIVKDGRKIIAKVYDRPIYYKKHNLANKYNDKYQYSLEIPSIGQKDCENLNDVVSMINKHTGRDDRVMFGTIAK